MRAGSEDAVNGRRWRWCRNTQEQQLRASVVVGTLLGAAQAGLGSGNGAGRGSGAGGSGGSGGSELCYGRGI